MNRAAPSVAALADAVQNGTRAAHEATQRLDVKTMRDELAKVSSAIHISLCYGLREELALELARRGFGGGA